MSAPLPGKGLLRPLQKAFLALFARIPDQSQFYLTGGTALAEYYLGHRLSLDLDLFTAVDGLILPVSYQVEKLGATAGLPVTPVRRFATYVEFLVGDGQESLRVDLGLDSPYRFAPPVLSSYGVWVNDYDDLRVDKLLAYYGRAEPRDAVDLYFILQREPARPLLEQAKQKDPGFDLYWFAVALRRCATFPDEAERWPVRMLVPWQPTEIKRTFLEWSLAIIAEMAAG